VRPAALVALGVALFLFIPAVLVLFVRHPEPVGASLGVGVALMLGHRFLALPYFRAARGRKCIWCNRVLDGAAESGSVDVAAGTETVRFAACPAHAPFAERFFSWIDRLRLPLRAGIALPLLLLLGTLAARSFDSQVDAALATDLFRLLVGLTVELAALGSLLGRPAATPRAAFPLHNFSLLGLRNLLWIFRLVGIWWIFDAGRALLGRFPG